MAFEIDFIGVPKEFSQQDADAIAVRWKADNSYKVIVYDGGFKAHGEELVNHMKKYYFNGQNGIIDAVVVSHPDQDHTSGLKEILENFTVKALYMNRPWQYAVKLYGKVTDNRITKNSLEDRLRVKYSYINDLEKLAIEKGIPIYNAFEGTVIEGCLKVLSPSEEFYKSLIVESGKTPLENKKGAFMSEVHMNEFLSRLGSVLETWGVETLRENVSTSAENEMSVVLLGTVDNDRFLLVGDAGIKALDRAINYAESVLKISIRENVQFFQIPHHGGRHNVSPSILDRMIGEKVSIESLATKTAFVSVADGSDHPKKMVVNAYLRRGCKVYKNGNCNIWHHKDMPLRSRYSSIEIEKFNEYVEKWDD